MKSTISCLFCNEFVAQKKLINLDEFKKAKIKWLRDTIVARAFASLIQGDLTL
jgi:hypothetical protein